MSNGDDEAPPQDAEDEQADAASQGDDVSVEDLESRLDDVEGDIEAAESEADLDGVEVELDDVAATVEGADLPEPDDEDEESPREQLENRIESLRGDLEEARGPYAADVVDALEEAYTTIEEGEWTDQGEDDVAAAVASYLDAVSEPLGTTVDAPDADQPPEEHAEALDEVAALVDDAGLDPDEDADTIAALLEATEELQADLEAAQEWDDLTVREKLTAEGFYDRLPPEKLKDFPPELGVVRLAERENDPERILLALEYLNSDFMEENCLDALKRMGSPEAYDVMIARAGKRDVEAIAVLGKIADERALDTLLDYIEGESNPPLQRATLAALGEIGSEEATQAVADRLVAEDDEVRSHAARALGLIGDTRAVEPLSDVLADDDADTVRASAAWALNQIGTRAALEAAAEYDDDRAFTVQAEAEAAREALGGAEATP